MKKMFSKFRTSILTCNTLPNNKRIFIFQSQQLPELSTINHLLVENTWSVWVLLGIPMIRYFPRCWVRERERNGASQYTRHCWNGLVLALSTATRLLSDQCKSTLLAWLEHSRDCSSSDPCPSLHHWRFEKIVGVTMSKSP